MSARNILEAKDISKVIKYEILIKIGFKNKNKVLTNDIIRSIYYGKLKIE